MIVCKRCGNHNPSDNEFCESCGVFLEWEGERIVEAPAGTARPLPPPPGLVTRIKNAVLGDSAALPPPDPGDRRPDRAGPDAARHQSRPDQSRPATPSALLAKPLGETAEPPQPAAQVPTAPVARPKPQIKQAPSRAVNPGDLVCGTCGEVNGAERNFCRRCATSLAEIVPARRRWWQRRRAGSSGQGASMVAGQRPAAASGRPPKQGRAGRRARKVKGVGFAGFTSVRRVLALLAILGIGTGLAVPSLRSTITQKASDLFNSAKRAINPDYTPVSPDDTLTVASSAADGHGAALVADGGSNTYWLGAPDAPDAFVTLTFTPPTDLAKILITPGDQEAPANFKLQPRPKDVFVTAQDSTGARVGSAQISLKDDARPQEFGLSASNVSTVTIVTQSCFPDPALHVCAISEVEFFEQK